MLDGERDGVVQRGVSGFGRVARHARVRCSDARVPVVIPDAACARRRYRHDADDERSDGDAGLDELTCQGNPPEPRSLLPRLAAVPRRNQRAEVEGL